MSDQAELDQVTEQVADLDAQAEALRGQAKAAEAEARTHRVRIRTINTKRDPLRQRMMVLERKVGGRPLTALVAAKAKDDSDVAADYADFITFRDGKES